MESRDDCFGLQPIQFENSSIKPKRVYKFSSVWFGFKFDSSFGYNFMSKFS